MILVSLSTFSFFYRPKNSLREELEVDWDILDKEELDEDALEDDELDWDILEEEELVDGILDEDELDCDTLDEDELDIDCDELDDDVPVEHQKETKSEDFYTCRQREKRTFRVSSVRFFLKRPVFTACATNNQFLYMFLVQLFVFVY